MLTCYSGSRPLRLGCLGLLRGLPRPLRTLHSVNSLSRGSTELSGWQQWRSHWGQWHQQVSFPGSREGWAERDEGTDATDFHITFWRVAVWVQWPSSGKTPSCSGRSVIFCFIKAFYWLSWRQCALLKVKRIVFGQIPNYDGAIKSTHKINHHSDFVDHYLLMDVPLMLGAG